MLHPWRECEMTLAAEHDHPRPYTQVTLGRRGLLMPGRLYIGYKEAGGPLEIMDGQHMPLRRRHETEPVL
jgi:hypothetical protein